MIDHKLVNARSFFSCASHGQTFRWRSIVDSVLETLQQEFVSNTRMVRDVCP